MNFKKKLFAAAITGIFMAIAFTACVLAAGSTNPVSFISATQNNRSIVLKWKPVPEARKYIVRRTSGSTDGRTLIKGIAVYTVNQSGLTDTNHLVKGWGYNYNVNAYDKNGKMIASGSKSVIKIDTPSVTSVSAVSGKLNVKWKKNTNATRYVLQIAKGSGFSGAKTVYLDRNKDTTSVPGLEQGTSYTVRMCTEQTGYTWGSDFPKTTSRSAWAYRTVKIPQKSPVTPVILKTVFKEWINRNEGIYFSWYKANGAEGYKIFRRESTSGKWENVGNVSAGTFTYVDRNARIGKKYHYSVVGYKKTKNFSFINGMSQSKALVRLPAPKNILINKIDSKYYVTIYKNGLNNDQRAFDASDRLIVELFEKNGDKKTQIIKKNTLGRYSFDASGCENIRVRFGKVFNNYLYPGTWTSKINIKNNINNMALR